MINEITTDAAAAKKAYYAGQKVLVDKTVKPYRFYVGDNHGCKYLDEKYGGDWYLVTLSSSAGNKPADVFGNDSIEHTATITTFQQLVESAKTLVIDKAAALKAQDRGMKIVQNRESADQYIVVGDSDYDYSISLVDRLIGGNWLNTILKPDPEQPETVDLLTALSDIESYAFDLDNLRIAGHGGVDSGFMDRKYGGDWWRWNALSKTSQQKFINKFAGETNA